MRNINPLSMPDEEYLLLARKVQLILRVGQLLMENSADTARIVRTMKRVGAYAGIFGDQLTIHITYTTIMVSVGVNNFYITKLQKCVQHNVDMNIITEISKVTWRAIEEDYTLEDFEKRVERIANKKNKYTSIIINIGAALACGGVGKMFGCDLIAAIYTALAASVGFCIRRQCTLMGINAYMSIAISAFIATVIAYFTHFLPGSSTPWYPMLACTIFIVPGIPLINAVEDMMDSYITAGMTRAINTLLMVGAMTFGIVFAIKIFNVADFTYIPIVAHQSYFVYICAAFIAAAGFSTMFDLPPKLLWVVGLGGVICVVTRNLTVEYLGFGQPIGTLFGAMLVSIIVLKASHWFHVPTHVLNIPSVIPLMPGLYMYRLLFTIIDIDDIHINHFIEAFKGGVNAILVILAIAVGVTIPNIFAQKYINAINKKRLTRLLVQRKMNRHIKKSSQ